MADIRAKTASAAVPLHYFQFGEQVFLVEGPFKGVEVLYQMTDGEGRLGELFTMLSQPVKMSVPSASFRRTR